MEVPPRNVKRQREDTGCTGSVGCTPFSSRRESQTYSASLALRMRAWASWEACLGDWDCWASWMEFPAHPSWRGSLRGSRQRLQKQTHLRPINAHLDGSIYRLTVVSLHCHLASGALTDKLPELKRDGPIHLWGITQHLGEENFCPSL